MKPFLHTLILSSVLVALLASCGTSVPNPNPGTTPTTPTTPTNPTSPTQPAPIPTTPPVTPTASVSFKTAAVLPEGVKDLEQDLTPSLVEVVALARSKTQNANTLTGTLTQTSNSFTYSATPTDRLKLVLSSGKTFEFAITKFQGNLSNGANAFYKADHLVAYRANFDAEGIGAVSMLVTSQRQGTVLTVRLGGVANFEGITNSLNLNYKQQLISDFGPDSIEFHHSDLLQGTILANNVSVQVNESYDFKVVGGSSSLVLQTIRTFDNAWTEGGAQFRLQNGRIQKVFRDGKPIEADFWKAQGVLSRNGTQVGGLGQAFTGNILEFFFDTPNGRIRLEANQF